MSRSMPFVLGAALACAVLVPSLFGCGSAKKACSSSTCQGCCDAAGECQTGLTTQACGTLGAFCTTCPGAQFCQFGVCVPVTGAGGGGGSGGGVGGGVGGGGGGNDGGTGGGLGGGSGGGGGSTACGPLSCSGCCSGGQCLLGTSTTACGGGGLDCQVCFPSQYCSDSTCWDSACSGCVNASGCQAGTTPQACGSSGRTCVQCASAADCLGSSCSNPGCTGCQDELGRCFLGTTNAACGHFGYQCVVCGPGRQCIEGVCEQVFPDGGLCKGAEQSCTTGAECCSGYCNPSGSFCSAP